jgi:hypothetical protein
LRVHGRFACDDLVELDEQFAELAETVLAERCGPVAFRLGNDTTRIIGMSARPRSVIPMRRARRSAGSGWRSR